MREIKFRALLENETGRWWEYYTTLHKPAWNDPFFGAKIIVKDLQFTGLLDKNGREIYEGDCCAVTDPYNGATAGPARVMFSYEYVGGWVLTSDGENRLNIGTRTQHVAVIGNIHENPKLMEEI